ncbi:MAG TPA: fibronectin type III domain-containing protein [Candidatus Thermoplasmatota archaeon]|nr:fibronectin type III domain-containing protein [Candidatus Thermoplasmatota archaeon]
MSLRALSLASLALALLSPAAAAQGACIPGLAAYRDDDGSFTLSWPPVEGATGYQVLVRPAGGEFTPLSPQVAPPGNTFTHQPPGDEDTYEFAVMALHGEGGEMEAYCHVVVARIPFFPTWTGTVLGLGGALACVSFVLRRRGA